MNVHRSWALAVVGCAALALTACHRPEVLGGKPSAPTGEVVAKVDGHEITLRQLRSELQGVQVADPKQMKAVEQRALQLIIIRTLMADAARKQSIDKTPDFVMQRDRMVDGLLAQMLQAKTAKAVPAPSPEEVDRFISDHPDIFAQRKTFDVDQIRFARPTDPATVKGLQPLNTLDAIASYLTSKNVKWTRGDARIDVVGLDPRLVDAISKAPQDEPFVMVSGDTLLVNQIKSSTVLPLQGAAATKYATALLTRQHMQEAVQREAQQVVAVGMKQVAYNPAYAPPASPRAPAASNSVGAVSSNAARAP
jgi:EpsD family peptidyl-prolyl cis-trans isomerase